MQEKKTYITLWLNNARTTKDGKEIKANFSMSNPITIDEYHYLKAIENNASLGAFPIYSKKDNSLIGVKIFTKTALQTQRDMEFKAKSKERYAAYKASKQGKIEDINF